VEDMTGEGYIDCGAGEEKCASEAVPREEP
jgi:hypothetical protein